MLGDQSSYGILADMILVCVHMSAYVNVLAKIYGLMFIRSTITQNLLVYFLEAAVTANGGCPSKNKDRLWNRKWRCSSISNIAKA